MPEPKQNELPPVTVTTKLCQSKQMTEPMISKAKGSFVVTSPLREHRIGRITTLFSVLPFRQKNDTPRPVKVSLDEDTGRIRSESYWEMLNIVSHTNLNSCLFLWVSLHILLSSKSLLKNEKKDYGSTYSHTNFSYL